MTHFDELLKELKKPNDTQPIFDFTKKTYRWMRFLEFKVPPFMGVKPKGTATLLFVLSQPIGTDDWHMIMKYIGGVSGFQRVTGYNITPKNKGTYDLEFANLKESVDRLAAIMVGDGATVLKDKQYTFIEYQTPEDGNSQLVSSGFFKELKL